MDVQVNTYIVHYRYTDNVAIVHANSVKDAYMKALGYGIICKVEIYPS